jgi:CRP-like cAMP-binding protein
MGRLFDTAQVAAGVTIARPEASGRWLFVLLDGVVAVGSGSRSPRVLGPGTAWGRLASDGDPGADPSHIQRPTSLTALSALTILSIDRRSFGALERVKPDIARELSHLAASDGQRGDVVPLPDSVTPVLVVVA